MQMFYRFITQYVPSVMYLNIPQLVISVSNHFLRKIGRDLFAAAFLIPSAFVIFFCAFNV